MCKACDERGKAWEGDDPKCAFPGGKEFNADNWNCATMNRLRDLCSETALWNEDQNAALLCGVDSQHVVLHWYKRRGRTEGAYMLDNGLATPLTLAEAEKIINRG